MRRASEKRGRLPVQHPVGSRQRHVAGNETRRDLEPQQTAQRRQGHMDSRSAARPCQMGWLR